MTSGPPAAIGAASRAHLDVVARREGTPWRERLAWSAGQLPLLDPGSEDDERLSAWEATVDPDRLGQAVGRWALDGLTSVTALVAVGSRTPPDAAWPDWWPWFERVRAACERGAADVQADEWLSTTDDLLGAGSAQIPYAHLFAAVAEEAWQRVASGHPMGAVSTRAGSDLKRWLLRRLSEAAAPALNELRTAAWPFGRRLATVVGPEPAGVPRDDYASFCHRQSLGGLDEVQRAFPVLPSLVGTIVRQWSGATAELLDRLHRDRRELEDVLGVPRVAELTGVRCGMGDTHHDGRAVCTLEFGALAVVYKPRDVRLEDFLHGAVDLVNAHMPDEPLLSPAVLPRSDQAGQAYAALAGATSALAAAVSSVGAVLTARAMLDSAQDVLHSQPESGTGREVAPLAGSIDLRDVGFRYSPDLPLILRGVTLSIPAGAHVAIVGPSGCGKSTLLRLLLGLEDPESGIVSFDGRDVTALDRSAVRRQIGAVMQSSALIPGNIRDNVDLGRGYSATEIWRALAEAAAAEDVRAMPMGLNTVIVEGAGTISGGQRQRILLARALIGRPRILVLDEATSAMDNISQAAVVASLDRLAATRVVVAHRLSTIESADLVVMLADGVVVAQGPYRELAGVPGPFRDLIARQHL